MRILSLSHTLAGTPTDIVIFPNGAADENDAIMGSGMIKRMKIAHSDGSARPEITVDIYDACIGNIGRAVRGGTGGLTDTYRVISGGVLVQTDQGDPYTINTPDAQLTACRKLIDGYEVELGTDPASDELPFEGIASTMGMAIHLNISTAVTGVISIHMQYEPWVSGGTRKTRRDLAAPFIGNIPL